MTGRRHLVAETEPGAGVMPSVQDTVRALETSSGRETPEVLGLSGPRIVRADRSTDEAGSADGIFSPFARLLSQVQRPQARAKQHLDFAPRRLAGARWQSI